MKPKILIVDDKYENLVALEKLLNDFEVTIIKATSGNEAITHTLDHEFALILIDVQMPGMDGFETIEILKQDERNNYIPVIFVSAIYSENFYKIKGIESGAIDFLTKPLVPEILRGKVKFFIEYFLQKKALEVAAAELEESNESLNDLNYKLSDSEKQLIDINAQKDKLFSIIAHDLKSPLSSLIGLSEMILMDRDDLSVEEILSFIESIRDTSIGIHDLLENLLKWSMLQTQRMSFQPEYLKFEEIVESVKSIINAAALKKAITIAKEIPAGTFIFADKNMIYTVMRNLLSNAIKFTPRNGSITIAACPVDEYIEISVTDTGVGIDPEVLPNIFKVGKYKSTHGTDNEKGTGLGLILCKELVEENKGKIGLECVPGKGTKVFFKLPHGD